MGWRAWYATGAAVSSGEVEVPDRSGGAATALIRQDAAVQMIGQSVSSMLGRTKVAVNSREILANQQLQEADRMGGLRQNG